VIFQTSTSTRPNFGSRSEILGGTAPESIRTPESGRNPNFRSGTRFRGGTPRKPSFGRPEPSGTRFQGGYPPLFIKGRLKVSFPKLDSPNLHLNVQKVPFFREIPSPSALDFRGVVRFSRNPGGYPPSFDRFRGSGRRKRGSGGPEPRKWPFSWKSGFRTTFGRFRPFFSKKWVPDRFRGSGPRNRVPGVPDPNFRQKLGSRPKFRVPDRNLVGDARIPISAVPAKFWHPGEFSGVMFSPDRSLAI
jgi:hypothetical protein